MDGKEEVGGEPRGVNGGEIPVTSFSQSGVREKMAPRSVCVRV